MTHIYLIRHAEAEGNIYRRSHGWYDSEVTSRGRKQIDALAERFKDVPVDAVYSSDLRRTIATAGAITKYHDLTVTPLEALREQNLGAWEDESFGDCEKNDPDMMRAFNYDPENWSVPGAESFRHLQNRIYGAIAEIAAANSGRTVCVVSHGMAIRSFLTRAMGLSSGEISRIPHGDNTSVASFFMEGNAVRFEYINDNSHVPASLSTFAHQSWWREDTNGGRDLGNLTYRPLDFASQSQVYSDFYRDAWVSVHGTEQGFYAEDYLPSAQKHAKADPMCIALAYYGDTPAGMIETDISSAASAGRGNICLVIVKRSLRGQQLGVQLLGHAVSLCRRHHLQKLTLKCFEGNKVAMNFYREYGFETVGSTRGVFGNLMIMEKPL